MWRSLMEIGFSEYEAKAYMALLKNYPATAYEIAKLAGLPTSKIYQVLAKLKERGAVLAVDEERKCKFVPQSAEELLAGYRNRMERTLSDLKTGLDSLRNDQQVSYIWNVTGYDYLLDKARRMIQDAKERLLISAWPEEAGKLATVLRQAVKRKVKVAIVHFGPASALPGQVFPHPIEDTLYAEKGGRGLVVAADSSEVLFGKITADGQVEGASSRNAGFLAMAEDYIKHDIYIMKIVQRFDCELLERFGENYHKLRDVFRNEEAS